MPRPFVLIAALLLAGTSSSLPAQGFEGVSTFLVQPEQGTAAPDTIVQYTKGDRMRVIRAAEGIWMVWDGSRWLAMLTQKKKYAIVPNMSGKTQLGGAPIDDKGGEAVSLGKSSVVAGTKCELWHVKASDPNGKLQDADVCLAKGAGFMVGRMTLNAFGRTFPAAGLAYDAARLSGMGVLSVSRNGKAMFTADKMRATPLSDTLFVAPPNYKSTNTGDLLFGP